MHHVSVSQAMGNRLEPTLSRIDRVAANPEFLIDREINRVASQLQLGIADFRDCALSRKS